MSKLSEEDIALAGEFVLGLLDTAIEAQATARIATDADFSAEVEAWRERLSPMFAGDVAPPERVWGAIESSLPSPSNQDVGSGKLVFWRTLTGISVSAAAILGILLLQKPDVIPLPEPEAPLIAALGSESGTASLTASYNSDSGQMVITPVSLDTGRLYPELWVIPADGIPRSLGMVDSTKPIAIVIPAEFRPHLGQGSTLAITPEPQTGGPGGKPTGPVIASGKITNL